MLNINWTDTIWHFETDNFIISVVADYDNQIPLKDTMDDDLLADTLPKIKSGELTLFGVSVSVRHRLTGMILASDYLGGCVYPDIKDFRDHIGINIKSQRDDRNYGSYFSDMIRTICKEARDRYFEFRLALSVEKPLIKKD